MFAAILLLFVFVVKILMIFAIIAVVYVLCVAINYIISNINSKR